MTDPLTYTSTCKGCGYTQTSQEPMPTADHCWQCPPWECEDCGETLTVDDLCRCWTVVEGLPLADLKALFALGDMSVAADD